MAGDAANIVLGAIIEKAITPVVNVIGRQLGYLFCYKSNIKNLAETAAQLENSRKDADESFKAQRRNNEEPAQSSLGWLEGVEKVIKDAEEVEKAADEFKGCLNLKGRYVLSRKSAKLAVDIQKLQSKAPKGITAHTLPAGMIPGAAANKLCEDFRTRKQTMDEVMKALEDEAISVIEICGLGGVGKTTMVHDVRERAREKNLFDVTAISTVSQTQDLFKIQGDLAEMLGLKALKEEKNDIARADQLCKRITGGNKVLIILDDVWSDIDLKKVGIPIGSDNRKCKVVVTSRQKRVWNDILYKSIELQVLDKKEARDLFRKTAGEHVEKNNLGEIADEVADECGGLPISLLTLSRALSNKDRRVWEDALARLREGQLTGINGMEKYVYQSIKLSYDFLAMEKQEEAQSLLLLCCQHQEDARISVEKLARYCLSLDLFEGITGVVRARNRVYSLVEHLKCCFLLQAVVDEDKEEGDEGDERVKVHDVVRDVCLAIVSRVENERDRVYMHNWKEEDDAGIGNSDPDFQKLKLLMQVPLHRHDISGIISFLEKTQQLRVLESCRDYGDFSLLTKYADPSLAPQFLTYLRMLSLDNTNVYPGGVMSEFTRLKDLKILSFTGSTILSFPHQIGELSNLRLLDLRCRYEPMCLSIILIPSGIVAKLTKLEVLYMGRHRFSGAVPYKDEDGIYEIISPSGPARIEELDSLTNLTTLQVNLFDPMQLLDLKNFHFEKLEGFSFGSAIYYSNDVFPVLMKNICLKEVGMKWVLGDKIQSIVRSTEDLSLEDTKDWTDPLIIGMFVSLKKLLLTSCHGLEYIIHDGNGDGVDDAMHSRGGNCSSNAFMNLEILTLYNMMNVRKLCHNGHLPEGLLHKLQKLLIYNLPEMRHLWVGPTDPLCLVNLKDVIIEKCGKLECIFPHSAAKCLLQLQNLSVESCGMLKGILSKGGEGNSTGRRGEITDELIIHFPKLTHVSIKCLPNLRGFYNLDDDAGQSLFTPLVILPSIENLIVHKNHSIKAVFDFKGLEPMTMRGDEHSLVCKLQKIDLVDLPKLEHICRQVPKDVLIFQNLQRLQVVDCGSLVYLIPSSIAHLLVNLQELDIKWCRGMEEVFSKMNEEDNCGELEKKIVFRSLRSVRLDDLKNLLSFCSSNQQVFEFPSLEELNITKCPKIETFCCQIPRVAHSGMLEENVSKGEETTTGGGQETEIYCNQAEIKMDPSELAALFPKLKLVFMWKAPNFRGFYNIDSYKVYQKLVNLELGASYQLKQMVEEGGDNLVSVAASSSINLVQNLKHITLTNCEAVKTVLDFEGFEVTREDAHSVFNRLETIWLHQLPNLEHICRRVPKEINGFQNLISLHVYGCHSLSYLLTSTMAHMLLNLKFLVVSNCKSMKEIIIMDENCGEKKIVFSSLCSVYLSSKKLSSFCSSELQEFDFPSLNHVYIDKCPIMKTFCCGYLTADKLRGVLFNIERVDDYDVDDDSDDNSIADDDLVYDDDADNVFWKGDIYDDDADNVFWKGDINETIRHFNSRANRKKSDPEEDASLAPVSLSLSLSLV